MLARLTQLALSLLAAAALAWSPFDTPPPRGDADAALGVEILEVSPHGRLVRHRAGTTRVPLHPQRICALQFADECLALGVTPAAASSDWSGRKADYLAERLASATPIPHSLGQWLPNLEILAAQRPDLILTWVGDQHRYEQLSRIAPTVVLRDIGQILAENGDLPRLEQRLRDVAAVLGLEPRAEAAIADFRAELARAHDLLHPRMDGKTIAFIRARGREWRLYGRTDDCGGEAIYDGLDLAAPDLVRDHGLNLDPPRLIDFDADYLIVVSDFILGSDEALDRLRRNRLWRRVPAVRDGHVLQAPHFEHWVLSGLLGKTLMIRDVLRCVGVDEARAP